VRQRERRPRKAGDDPDEGRDYALQTITAHQDNMGGQRIAAQSTP
jgi:hypothetical protein